MIKIYKLQSGHRRFAGSLMPVADYLYVISLFGIIIHSVTLHDVDSDTAKLIFAGKKIIK